MHAIVVAVGSHGDVLPLIAIAARLKGRGHPVEMIAPAPFAAHAAAAGLAFAPLGTEAEFEEVFANPSLWRFFTGGRLLLQAVARTIRPVCELVLARSNGSRTVVVASTLALGARVAREIGRGPLVTVHLSPCMLESRNASLVLPGVGAAWWLPKRLRWRLQLGVDEWFIDPLIRPELNAFRAEHGLPPVGRVRHWWHSRRRVLLMFPDWFAERQPDWPEQAAQLDFPFGGRRTGQGVDAELADFLDGGPPPVAVTFGTGMRDAATLCGVAIAACDRIGRRAIILTRGAVAIPERMRGRVIQRDYAPLDRILPRCAALIHHGGVGTMAEAFAAGVPQLVTPLAFDQFDNADRIRRLGCGAALGRSSFRPRAAARLLKALIASPEGAEARGRVAALCAGTDAVGQAADAIEAEYERAREHRRGSRVAALTPSSGRS